MLVRARVGAALLATRWKSFSDWEQMFANPDFANELDRQSAFISAQGSAFVQLP
jgi:hypothetical protein